MPVPKRKTSRARRDSKNANMGLKPKAVCLCSNCSAPLATHQACLECGFYKGSKVLRTKNERTMQRDEIKQSKEARSKKHSEGKALEVEAEKVSDQEGTEK